MPSSQRGLICGEHLLGGLTNLKRRISSKDQTNSRIHDNETAAVLDELICPISARDMFSHLGIASALGVALPSH